jgi:OFA family oxalate/formate antiporter-like MFS transporter
MTLLQPTMVLALLVSGMGLALLGSIKVPLARRLAMDEARVGGLVSIFAFIMIPVIPVAGYLTDRFGPQPVFVGGSVLMGTSLFLLAQARSYAMALTAVLVLGGAWSFLINAGNVLTPLAFARGPDDFAYATNLANVFFGLGAFLTPLAVTGLMSRLSLPATLMCLGSFLLVPGLLALGIDFSALGFAGRAGDEATSVAADGLLTNPFVWLCGFALFFYGPLEACMGAWATSYLGEQGVGEREAAGFLSAFWLAYMAARLATAFTLPAGGEGYLILGLAVACVVLLTAMVMTRNPDAARVLVVFAGLIFGPIFPTLMAVLLGNTPATSHGQAVGMLFAVGGIGWTVVPLFLGAYAKRAGIRRGFSVAAVTAIGLTVVAAFLMLRLAG